MNKLFRLFFSIGLALLVPLAFAAPPQTINYQGYLTNPSGTPVNGAVVMTFRLYNAASGGTALFTETQLSVGVVNGNFNAVIGSVSPIALPFDVPYWLTVAINADGEMSPRQPLASSPYAFRAASLDSAATVAGSQITGDINATGNILLPNSTASAGNILKGGVPFIHNFGAFNLNTFIGVNAGNFTMTGESNSAIGKDAFNQNTTGSYNTAIGSTALRDNSTGYTNTAIGAQALPKNTTGSDNVAIGNAVLINNTTGGRNTASGSGVLFSNTTGSDNSATGNSALGFNTIGSLNTAIGRTSLGSNTTGSNNIGIGDYAGGNLTTGDNNIAIGNFGVAAESNTIRLGTTGFQTRAFISGIRSVPTGSANAIAVLIDSNGQLGTLSSSRRFKDNIADMDASSSALTRLRPVTFHYKTDQNPTGRSLQYGLIAEEVAEIYPELVAHSSDRQIESVMYQHLPPMLLNEFQKQQRTIDAQAARINALEMQASELAMLRQQVAKIANLQLQAARQAQAAR